MNDAGRHGKQTPTRMGARRRLECLAKEGSLGRAIRIAYGENRIIFLTQREYEQWLARCGEARSMRRDAFDKFIREQVASGPGASLQAGEQGGAHGQLQSETKGD